MPTTAINALRKPALSNNPNVPLDISNLADDVDSRLVGRFTSAALRDAAIPAPIDGMLVYVSGAGFMERRLGAWIPLTAPAPVITVGNTTSRADGIEESWFVLTIPDPGYPYRIEANAWVRLFVTNGTRADVRLRAGASGGTDAALPIVTFSSGMSNDTTGLDLTLPTRTTPSVITGDGRLVGFCQRLAGAGSWSITPAPSVYYRVVPA